MKTKIEYPLFTNNARRRAGLAPLRKVYKRKPRYQGRNKSREAINALLDWCDQ